MYAKLHNVSISQLVEKYLSRLQIPKAQTETEDYLDGIDEELMKQTFETAHQDYLAGRCVPNSQVVDYIKGELGWK